MSVNRDTSPHVIRLRGPWSYEDLVIEHNDAGDDTEKLPQDGTVHLPMELDKVFGPRVTRVVMRRRFGHPSNLAASQRVDLVVQQLDMHGELSLNGKPLGQLAGARGATRFEVTELLANRNEIKLELGQQTASPPRLLLELRLEIAAG